MSEFLNRLEMVKTKGVEVTGIMVKFTDTFIEFVNAFDGLYSYCMDAHEAKAKREGRPVQISEGPQTEKHPLRSAYQELD